MHTPFREYPSDSWRQKLLQGHALRCSPGRKQWRSRTPSATSVRRVISFKLSHKSSMNVKEGRSVRRGCRGYPFPIRGGGGFCGTTPSLAASADAFAACGDLGTSM
eukprot:5135744-Pleurochrysis_carterae.AAC.1